MGDYACLGADVDCYCVDKITVGDQATVSQGVKLCSASHDISSRTMELKTRPITIGASSWIAAWSIIMPGVNIGDGAVVAAGSVIAKSIDPWLVVGGNPAVLIKKRTLEGESI